MAVARFRHDLDVLLAGEQHPQASADHRLVVGDEHADAPSRRRVGDRRQLIGGVVQRYLGLGRLCVLEHVRPSIRHLRIGQVCPVSRKLR